MILFIIFFSFFSSSFSVADTHAPSEDDGDLTLSPSIRVIGQNSSHTFLASYENLNLSNNQEVNSIGLTYRYRLASHSKIGFQLQQKSGLLHDRDWIEEDKSGKFVWRETHDRTEYITSIEYQYRSVLAGLLGDSWIGEIRSSIDYNTHLSSLFFRPRFGITYFSFIKGKPAFNLFFRFTPYMRLSESLGSLYEISSYTGGAYNITDMFQISLNYQFINQSWKFSNGANSSQKTHVFGINLNILFTDI